MKTYKTKGLKKLRLAGLLLAFAMAAASITSAGVLLGSQNADAMGSGTTVNLTSNDIYGTNQFNGTYLTSFINALGTDITGSNVNDRYDSLESYLNSRGGALNATQIAALNSNQGDVRVRFAGQNWTVTYLSKTRAGDVIATLWLENPTTTGTTFSANGWYSNYRGFTGTVPNHTPIHYYSNQYGSSWIRSSVLNIGSAYVSAPAGSQTDSAVTIVDGTQSTSSAWARFTMPTATNSVVSYLATPSEVAWQEDLYVRAVNSTHILQSEAYGTPWGGRWYSPSDNTSDPRDLRDAPNKFQYNAWQNDPIWLPALSETGWTGVQGYWNTTTNQREYSNTTLNTWLRSGGVDNTSSAYYLQPGGGLSINRVSASYAVRPALHLNLKSAALSAAGSAGTGTKLRLPTIDGAVSYNGEQQEFHIYNYNREQMEISTNANGGDGAFNGDTVSKTNAGTYTVTITPNSGYCWANGSSSAITLQATINPRTVYADWTAGTQFIYNRQSQQREATARDVNNNALGLEYSYAYAASAAATKAAATATVIAGYYEVTAAFADTQANYTLSGNTAEYQILPKTITATGAIGVNDKYYDGTTTATVSAENSTLELVGVETGDTVTVATTGSAGAYAFESAEVGSHFVSVTLEISGADAANYTLATTAFQSYARILPIPVTVTATAADKVYNGNAAAALTAASFAVDQTALDSNVSYTLITLQNIVSGDSSLGATLTGEFADKNAANGKSVTVTGVTLTGATAEHYSVELANTQTANSSLTANITKADLTVNIAAPSGGFSITYGDVLSVQYSSSGPISGESVALTLTYTGRNDTTYNSTTAPTNAGEYTVTATVATADTNGTTNYNISSSSVATADITIAKKDLTVKADDFTITYGDAAPAYTASYSGFVNGEGVSVLTGTLNITCTYEQGEDADSYVITPDFATGTYESDNYNLIAVTGILTVEMKTVYVLIATDLTQVYSGTITTNFSDNTDNKIWSLAQTAGNTLYGSDMITVNVTAPSSANVGDYMLTGTATETNYNVIVIPGYYRITKATLTVTAADNTVEYGSAPQASAQSVTYAGFVNNETENTAGAVTPANTYRFTYSQYGDVFESDGTTKIEYEIIPYGWTSANYDIVYVAGTLTVNPKAVTVSISDVTATYGDELINPSDKAYWSATGVVNGDNLGVMLTLTGATGGAYNAGGSYRIEADGTGWSNANYAVTFVSAVRPTDTAGNYTVNKATLTVTANNAEIVYGTANADIPANGVTYTGFVNGEDETVLTGATVTLNYSYNDSAAATRGVGTYTITPDVSALSDTNYNFVAGTDGVLTVTKAVLTITADDKTRAYDGTAAANDLTATVTGLEFSDTEADLNISLTRGRATESNVGSYVITATADGAVCANYDITYVNGTYTITPFQINVYWLNGQDLNFNEANYSKPSSIAYTYDGQEHVPVAQYRGLNGAWATLNVSGVRTNANAVGGTYMAEAYLPNSANYEFATDGEDKQNFVINRATLSVTWIGADGNTAITDLTSGNDAAAQYEFRRGVAQAPTVLLTGVASGETLTAGTDYVVTGANISAGSWTASIIIISPNYTATASLTCQFTIRQVAPSSFGWYESIDTPANTGNILSVSPAYDYDGQSHYPVIKSGVDDTYAYTLYMQVSREWRIVNSAVNAGTYKVEAEPVRSDYVLDKDVAFQGYVEFTIEQKEVTLEWLNVLGDNTNGYYYDYNGGVQKPDARFMNEYGNYVYFAVDYSNANSAEASETPYTATVTLPENGNYVFADGSYSATIDYTINARSITVTWDFNTNQWIEESGGDWTAAYSGNEYQYLINQTAEMVKTLSDEGIQLSWNVYRLEGSNRIAVPDKIIKNAGVYVLAVEFGGSASNYSLVNSANSNYSLVNAERQFTVTKLDLTITPEDLEVTYGQTLAGYVLGRNAFNGLLSTEEADILSNLTQTSGGTTYASGNWLTSSYTPTSAPTTSDNPPLVIGLTTNPTVLSWFEDILANYNYVLVPARITILAQDGDVRLQGDSPANGDMVYTGEALLPQAFYHQSSNANNPWVTLNVILVGAVGDATLTDGNAVNAGTYEVRVEEIGGNTLNIDPAQTYQFTILKREIHVGISDLNFTYGNITEEGENGYRNKLVWNYTAAGVRPLAGDNLDISLSVAFNSNSFDEGGYVNAGAYRIQGDWNSADFADNYNVTFEGSQSNASGANNQGLLTVNAAEITVTKQGTQWFNEEATLPEADYYYVSLANKNGDEYQFINFSGWKDASVTVNYSRLYTRGGTDVPAPEDESDWRINIPTIGSVGEFVINYHIQIANHNDLYGQWFVLIKAEDEYVIIIFQRDYEVTYGDELPENLAEELIDGGYVQITGALALADVRRAATAYAFNGSAQNVTRTTGVGKYSIYFELDDSVPDNLEVIYKRNNTQAYTNEGRYVINPRTLSVNWGVTDFEYDGRVHMPTDIALGGWINGESLALDGLEAGQTKTFTYTDIGAESITVTVKAGTAENHDFVSNGGHQIVVSVDNSNYSLDIENASKTISISVAEENLTGGLPQWALWAIIAAGAALVLTIVILAVVAKKRKGSAKDEGGFYEDAE